MTKPLVAIIARGTAAEPLRELLADLFARAEPAAFEPERAAHFGQRCGGLAGGVPGRTRRVARRGVGRTRGRSRAAPRRRCSQGHPDLEPRHRCGRGRERRPRPCDHRPATRSRGRLRPRFAPTSATPAAFPSAPSPSSTTSKVVRGVGAPLDADAVDTALACAAVVVVRGAALVRALAWGAPIVTDVDTIARTAGRCRPRCRRRRRRRAARRRRCSTTNHARPRSAGTRASATRRTSTGSARCSTCAVGSNCCRRGSTGSRRSWTSCRHRSTPRRSRACYARLAPFVR